MLLSKLVMHNFIRSVLFFAFTGTAVQGAALVNPGRGIATTASKWSNVVEPGVPITFAQEVAWAVGNGSNVLDRPYNLEPWMNNPEIGKAVTDALDADLKLCREKGVRLIVSFFYSDNATTNTMLGPNGLIPGNQYDAPLDIALKHWAKIAPILKANAAAIDNFETSFIGTWGEQFYTWNYNTTTRGVLFRAMLESLPEDMPVSWRGPNLLTSAINSGIDAKYLKKNRLGIYDHCILNSAGDAGTFGDKQITIETPDAEAFAMIAKDMEPFGVATTGECCLAAGMTFADKYLKCDYSLHHMELIHLTSLNEGFKDGPEWDAVKEWKKTGCWQKILDRLGYVPSYVKSDTTSVTIKNTGFASPYHPNDVHLLVVPTSQMNNAKGTITKAYRINQQIDIRTLAPGKDTTYPLTISGAGSVTLDEDYDAVMVIETGHVPDVPYRIIFTEPTQQIWKDYRANPLRDIHLPAGTILDASAQAVTGAL